MGEITDALRRAREEREARAEEPAEAPSRPRPVPEEATSPPAPPPRPLERPPLSGPGFEPIAKSQHEVEELEPWDPAIVVREGPEVEACRRVALRLRAEAERLGLKSLAVVSAVRDEGKTTVTCDTAVALAAMGGGMRIALVDLDLRKPSIAHVLSVPAERGIEEVLLGEATLDDVVISVQHPPLDVYAAVRPQRTAHELLALPRTARTLHELEARYDLVLIDTPPALLLPDVGLILKHVGACVPVARVGHSRARTFKQLVESLPAEQTLGVLLNGGRMPHQSYYYGYYGGAPADEE